MFGNRRPFSYSSGAFPQEDITMQKWSFLPDDHKQPSLQRNMSRPNGRSIYMQRKEYSETLNTQSDNFHFRVEHLFTCELDGQELNTVDDCLAKLKRLDVKGRLWPQEMIMEIHGAYLVFSDIETKTELESHSLSSILQTKAVLDSCAYDSVLVITLRERSKRLPQVFMFQCEETGADNIKSDLDKVAHIGDDDEELHRDQSDVRINLENIIGQHTLGNFRQLGSRPVQKTPSPMYNPSSPWGESDFTDPDSFYIPGSTHSSDNEITEEIPPLPVRREKVKKKNIFNHVLDDVEIFMDKVAAALSASQKDSSKTNLMKIGKSKNKAASLPPLQEYVSCLQKIKYGFNLLGQLDGTITNPSAEEFVHIFFSCLTLIVSQYPSDVPSTVVSPLLTVAALRLLSQAVDPTEDQLWRSLGDSWNLSRAGWPHDIPPYMPEFYDGWQPPPPSRMPSPLPDENGPMSRSNSRRSSLGLHLPEEPVTSDSWGRPSPVPRSEPHLYMRVIYDFMARNNQELSIMKGEFVQVIQKSKQWWLVRNSRGEEGSVPQNVLEPVSRSGSMEDLSRSQSPVTLDMKSTPAEVKAWLEYKGFSRVTVDSLGVLTGKQLLRMSKNDLRTVSPEDGAKVFFQLQAVKSAIALNSESSGRYSGRY